MWCFSSKLGRREERWLVPIPSVNIAYIGRPAHVSTEYIPHRIVLRYVIIDRRKEDR